MSGNRCLITPMMYYIAEPADAVRGFVVLGADVEVRTWDVGSGGAGYAIRTEDTGHAVP